MALPDLKGKEIFEAVPDRKSPVSVIPVLVAGFSFAAAPKRSFELSRDPVFERNEEPKPVFEAPGVAPFVPGIIIPKPLLCTPMFPTSWELARTTMPKPVLMVTGSETGAAVAIAGGKTAVVEGKTATRFGGPHTHAPSSRM